MHYKLYYKTPSLQKHLSERRTKSKKQQPAKPPKYHIQSSQVLYLHNGALVPSSWLIGILLLLNLPDHKLKSLGDVLVVPRACLRVSTVVRFSKGFAFLDGDLTLVWTQITLVCHNDNRNPFGALKKMSALKNRIRMMVDLPSDSESYL